jgi:hypothetical protein
VFLCNAINAPFTNAPGCADTPMARAERCAGIFALHEARSGILLAHFKRSSASGETEW